MSGKSFLANSIRGCVLGGVLAVAYSSVSDPPDLQTRASETIEWDHVDLHDGDLIFRRGRDVASRLVLSAGDSSRFSHVGMIVTWRNSPFVLHSMPTEGGTRDGVRLESLASFSAAENASAVAVYRVRKIESEQRDRIRAFGLRQVGKPFDYRFELSDTSRIYCSELLVSSLAAGGIDVIPSVRLMEVMTAVEPLLSPDDLRKSSLLDVLLVHLDSTTVACRDCVTSSLTRRMSAAVLR